MVRPTKVTIDSHIGSRIYEKSIGTNMNDLDLCLEVASRSCQVINHCVTLDVEYLGNRQTVRAKDLVPKGHQ